MGRFTLQLKWRCTIMSVGLVRAVGVHRIYDRAPFEFFPHCSIDLANPRSHVSKKSQKTSTLNHFSAVFLLYFGLQKFGRQI
jgi:hypothetical protein